MPAGAGRYRMEPLEQRTLLTTLSGFNDDVFEYRDELDQVIRVKVTGNIRVELIGAQVNRRTNEIALVNLPGSLNGDQVFGGLNPAPGLAPIGTISVNGAFTANISAIAAAADGTLYAINTLTNFVDPLTGQQGTGNQIVQLTVPAGGVGPVIGTVLGTVFTPNGSNNPGLPLQVMGADVSANGLLYFVASTPVGTTNLFSVNPLVANPFTLADEVAESLNAAPTALNLPQGANNAPPLVQSIAFGPGGTLFGIHAGTDLITISTGTGELLSRNPIIDDANNAVNALVGLDFNNNGQLLAIQSGDDAMVFDLDLGAGVPPVARAFELGPLGTISASGLAFVPGLSDPFTGSTAGAYVGVDLVTDQLFFVNATDRLPAQFLYNIYVAESDLTGQISIGYVRELEQIPFPNPYVMRVNDGDIGGGGLRVLNAASGDPNYVAAPPAQSGRVLIGARTQDISDVDMTEDLRPFEIAGLPADIDFGLLPDNITQLRPGLIVEEGADLGKFLLGGTLTGAVDARGSIDFMYAGWLLTGDVGGQASAQTVNVPDNFVVAGDLRNLVVLGDIGTESGAGLDNPTYVTGFDMRVGGTVGQISAGKFEGVGLDSAFYGSIEVNHLDPRQAGGVPRIERNQFEAEYHALPNLPSNVGLVDGFENFNFAFNTNTFAFNDSYNTAEYLGSISSSEIGRSEVVRLSGTLDVRDVDYRDPADFYAVSLMAGQRYTARLEGAEGVLALGVFDPDGRLIASEYNDTNQLETSGQFFSFVADRPGIYRFGISPLGDAPAFDSSILRLIGPPIPYTLTVLGIGDIALGGLVIASTFYDTFDAGAVDPGIEIFRGDLGAVKSYAGRILSDNTDTFVVEVGNLRTIDGMHIGQVTDNVLSNAPWVDVPEGNVGLVRAASPPPQGGAIDTDAADTGLSLLFNFGNTRPIGGDYQLIDGPGATVLVELHANKGIGVIRAEQFGVTNAAPVLNVNADDRGEDGIIDLIDVSEDFGTITAGGPEITTNTGGNVRYIRVLGTIYRDLFFGSGDPENTIHGAGETVTIIDDSGARVRLNAIGQTVPNPAFNPQFPQRGVPERLGPQMFITTYGIRDSGGSVIVDVTSEGGLEVNVSEGTHAEIGRAEIRGVGVEVVEGALVDDADHPTGFRRQLLLSPGTLVEDDGGGGGGQDPNALIDENNNGIDDRDEARVRPEDLVLRVGGSAIVDVLNVVVIDIGDDNTSEDSENTNELSSDGFYNQVITPGDNTSLGNALEITNSTGGEIVNVLAESVGTLSAKGSIGIAKRHTGADVAGIEVLLLGNDLRGGGARALREFRPTETIPIGTFQPFLNQREGVTIVGGNVLELRSGQAVGNIIVQGTVGQLTANADNQDDPNVFEGIAGPIGARSFVALERPELAGTLLEVDIGEGIAPSGTGNFSRAGLFVFAAIGRVRGTNADIRGDIIARNTEQDDGTTQGFVGPAIESITLNNGSIINADIYVTSDEADTLEFAGTVVVPNDPDPINGVSNEIGRITINGNGGIIGSNFLAADIGRVAINGGFGVFSSNFSGLADSRFAGIETDGYGIRNVDIDTAGSLTLLNARGDGTSLSTNAVHAQVRYSEFDPANDPNDADGVNDQVDPLTGFIDPFFGTNPNRLTDIHANLGTNIRQPEISGVTDTGVIEATAARGTRDLGTVRAWQIRGGSSLDFANSTRNLIVRDVINGLEMTTGTLKNFTLNRDAFALTLSVRGRVNKVDIKGSLAGGSVIRTVGTGGQFNTVNVSGNLIGNINSARSIKSINIGGDFTGNVSVNSGGTAIKTMKVGGAFISGSLDVRGNVGTLQTKGSLGSIGDTLTIDGSVKKIMVGGDLRSNIRVTGSLKNLTVKGSIVDGGLPNGLLIDISDTLGSLVVGGDIQSGVTINANRIGKQKVDGQNAGTIIIQQ
jgi:hypothetical protein